jgi:hypothetical protein
LSERKAAGESVDSRHIRKHKNDVFRLSEILSAAIMVDAPAAIKADLTDFCAAMENEAVDVSSLGLSLDKNRLADIVFPFSHTVILLRQTGSISSIWQVQKEPSLAKK